MCFDSSDYVVRATLATTFFRPQQRSSAPVNIKAGLNGLQHANCNAVNATDLTVRMPRTLFPNSQLTILTFRAMAEPPSNVLSTLPTQTDVPNAPTIPPTHRILAGPPYASFQELIDDLNAWGRVNGLAFVKSRSINLIKDFGYTRFDIICDRGKARASEATTRRTTTAKTGCNWMGAAKALLSNRRLWTFEILKQHHNHEASVTPADLTTHRTHRGLSERQKQQIDDLSKHVAIRSRDILQYLQAQDPEAVVIQKDVNNYRGRLAKANRQGYTGTQALIKTLEEAQANGSGIEFTVRYHEEDENLVIGLFWTYPWCTSMWRRFPGVLQMDNTYKTNRFNMPFFQITSINNVGSIYNIAFGLVDNERDDGFIWLTSQLRELQVRLSGIPEPDVVVTDSEQALKNALFSIYPFAQQQQCVFHINKNVIANIKRKWKAPGTPAVNTNTHDEEVLPAIYSLSLDSNDDDDVGNLGIGNNDDDDERSGGLVKSTDDIEHTMAGLYSLWKSMVYGQDEGEFNACWARICTEFSDQTAIIGYFERYWLPFKLEWAAVWTSRYRNYGIRTTSPTEAAHRDLKSYLIKGTSDLFRLHEVLVQMLRAKERAFLETVSHQKQKQRYQFSGKGSQWLGTTTREVAWKAIDRVNRQRRLALGSMPNRLNPRGKALPSCTGRFTKQWGMPCAHYLLEVFSSGRNLQKADFASHWWLEVPLDIDFPYMHIRDPLKVKGKGRPRGSGPFATSTASSTDRASTSDTDPGPPSTAPPALGWARGRGRHGATASARRTPSSWEIDDSDVVEVPGPSAKRRRQHQGQGSVTIVASDEPTGETQSSIYVGGR
jgi:hypothetical protein